MPGNNIGVATGSGQAYTPSIAVRHDGSIHLVRSEDVSTRPNIWYKQSATGVIWGPDQRISPSNVDAFNPRIAVELEPVTVQGRLYVAYQEGTGTSADIYFTRSDTGSTWNAPARIDLAGGNLESRSPAVAASNGYVYVAWSDLRNTPQEDVILRRSADGGVSWGQERLMSFISQSNDPPRIAAKGSTVVVAWVRDAASAAPRISLARSDDSGASWRWSNLTTPSITSMGFPSCDVALDELGVAHVAFTWRSGFGPEHIYYSTAGENLSWSFPVIVDDNFVSPAARYPSISTLAGSVWIVWSDARTGDYDISASWSQDGVKWGAGAADGQDLRVDDTDRNVPTADDASYQNIPALATGGYGVHVAWEDTRALTSDIYYSEVVVSPLVVTEIQDEPSTAERIEIYNFQRTSFSLNGVTLRAGSSTIDLTPLGSAAPRGYFTVGAAPADLVASINLNPEGDRVQLIQGADVLSSINYGQQGTAPDPLSGESTSRYAGAIDYSSAWTRSASTTFRARNAVPPPDMTPAIVLNEVLFDPSSAGYRFVELRLRTGTTLNATGYRIVSDSVYTMPSRVVGPFPYAVVMENDAPALFTAMSASGDNVYLYDSTGRLLDMVGWSQPHNPGTSIARVVDGVGGTTAYDDPSATANGWAFDSKPSAALIELLSDAIVDADIGTTLTFPLQAISHHNVSDYVNIEYSAVLPEWPVALKWPNGTLLTDSPGDLDSIVDLGLVGPGATVSFMAEVTIPVEAPLEDGNLVMVYAYLYSVPSAASMVNLNIWLRPHFDIYRDVNPYTVYLEGSGPPFAEVSAVAVTLRGTGHPIVSMAPQDVVFQIDVSGSMATSDPSDLRVDAVQHYIDGMTDEDRGSVIGFDDVAWVENNRPLTNTNPAGKVLLKGDANNLRCAVNPCLGGTNIDNALALGNQWIIIYGNRSRDRAEILLTDGVCDPPCMMTNFYVAQAVAEGIVIYTVGLGNLVDEAYLRSISGPTGGQYYHADTPQDLDAIYQDIAIRLNYTVGTDPDVTDSNPMIEDVVAPYIDILPGSFNDPITGLPKPPDYMKVLADRTILQWNLSTMKIGEMWSVVYSVKSTLAGLVEVALHPEARVSYTNWDGVLTQQPIPQGWLEVLTPPSPPYINATTPANGTIDVALNSPLIVEFSDDMNASSVTWTISPPLTVSPLWTSPRILQLDHLGMMDCTKYTVQITSGSSTGGQSLVPGPVPNPWEFNTICTEPYIVSTVPVDSSTGLPLDADIVVQFSEWMDAATVVWTFSEPGVSFSSSWDITSTVLTLSHTTPFQECSSVSMLIQGKDSSGLDLVPGPVPNPWGFATVCVDPFIVSTAPADLAVDVPLDPDIVVVFSEPMDVTTVSWSLSDPGIAFSSAWDVTNTTLTLSHVTLFVECSDLSMVIQGKDTVGLNLIPGPVPNPWSFRTICVPPVITSTVPVHGATDVPVNSGIEATFSEPMNTSTVSWTISPAFSPSPAWSNGDTVLSLVNSTFQPCTTYVVSVSGQDLTGISLVTGPVPNPWAFETHCPVTVTYTITRSPEQGDVAVDGASYPVPASFVWSPGDTHRIEAPDFDPMGGSRLAFSGWDDGGSRVHDVVVGLADQTITANYALQHQAVLTLLGLLPGNPATITFNLWGSASSASSASAWSSWVDAGSALSVSSLVSGIPGERFVTRDTTLWTVAAPLNAVVSYFHQFTAAVHLDALEGNSVAVSFTAFSLSGSATASPSWSEWVDAGTDVAVPDGLMIGPRERFRTLDDTSWRVDAPLDVTVTYIHQYKPRVTLVGTDSAHTVSAQWRVDIVDGQASGVSIEWYDWTDAGTQLQFSNKTIGAPPRDAQDPTTFVVGSAFNAQIRYSASEEPPAVSTGQPNWKPLLALVYVILLAVAGVFLGSRPLDLIVPSRAGEDPKEWRKRLRAMSFEQKKQVLTIAELEEKRQSDRLFTRFLLIVPFAAAEASIGIMSMQTGLFRIPEAGSWIPIGFWVNTLLVLAGLAVGLLVRLKGYVLTDDDLLALETVKTDGGEGEKEPQESEPATPSSDQGMKEEEQAADEQ